MKYKIKENKDQMSFSFRKNSWKTNSAVLLLCFAVLIFFSRATYKVYVSAKEAEESVVNTKVKLATLQEREKFLTEQLKKLDTADGREAELREKFGVGKPGENLAIIVATDPSKTMASTTVWASIKGFFSNLFK